MASVTAVGSRSPGMPGGWIASPAWDLFWMFSSLWGAVLLLSGGLVVEVGVVATLLFLGNRFLSTLHSWSTTYMVVFSPLLAEERRRNRRKYVWFPAGIVVVGMSLGLITGLWQRFPATGRFDTSLWAFGLYIGLFWVGHFWHFGNQDFGVLTIYRTRAGQNRPIDRKIDKFYTVAMMFVIQPVVYLSVVKTTAFSEMVRGILPIPADLHDLAAKACLGAACVLSAAVIGIELARPNRSLPKLLYYLVIFVHPVFLFGAVWAQQPAVAFLYIMAYLWSHWFIAVGLVSRINARYYESRGESPRSALIHHALLLGTIALAVWGLTQDYSEYALFNTDGWKYKQLLAAIQPGQAWIVGLVLGFFLTEQLLHYYCDRCLFRFRDAGVRKRVGPLLF